MEHSVSPSDPSDPPPHFEDTSYRVELPERNSTYFPYKRDTVSPTSPSLASPGLESAHSPDFAEKETQSPIVVQAEKEAYNNSAPELNEAQYRNKSRQRRWLWAIIAAVAVLAVGLGVGLGVGLTRNHGFVYIGSPVEFLLTQLSSRSRKNSTESLPPNNTSITAPVLSTTGAFNGSGIALASESFASGGYGSIVMYFQHHTGQIRSAQLGSDGSWKGGDVTEVVAADAKNGTPIAAVAYARNSTSSVSMPELIYRKQLLTFSKWHIFYINVNNTVAEVINSNTTNVWSPGPINDLHLQAMDDANVGLEACWYGAFYSDATYNHSPVPGQDQATSNDSDQTVGIHLWYASNSTSFDSVGWTYGDTSWTQHQTFNGYNGHAGVGCYSWGPGSDTYVFFVDMNDQVNILWKDLNTTVNATAKHPIDTWTDSKYSQVLPTSIELTCHLGNVTIPVYKNSSMGFTNYLYVQNPDLSISGFNVTWAAENTSIDASETFVVNGDKGLPGTHLSVTALPNKSGGNSLLTFYQTNGSDITEFVRDLDAGQWTSSSVPIPDA